MTDTLPRAGGLTDASPEVLAAALAMAAARIAAERAGAPPLVLPVTREDVERIAQAAVVEAFEKFGVNLESLESVEAHRATLEHARRGRVLWEKAGQTIMTALMTTFAGGLIAAVVKYLSIGGGK